MGICMSLRATKKRVTPQGSERAAEMGNALLRALLSLSLALSRSLASLSHRCAFRLMVCAHFRLLHALLQAQVPKRRHAGPEA